MKFYAEMESYAIRRMRTAHQQMSFVATTASSFWREALKTQQDRSMILPSGGSGSERASLRQFPLISRMTGSNS